MINSDDEYPELSDKVILGKEIDALRTRLATAEAQVAAAQSERDMARAMAAERAALRADLAAAKEQLADANRGYSLLCDEEARLNDDLAAARRALDTAQEDARQGWASMHAVEQTAADAIMERDAARRALEEMQAALDGTHFHHKAFEPLCTHCKVAEAALLAPERPR